MVFRCNIGLAFCHWCIDLSGGTVRLRNASLISATSKRQVPQRLCDRAVRNRVSIQTGAVVFRVRPNFDLQTRALLVAVIAQVLRDWKFCYTTAQLATTLQPSIRFENALRSNLGVYYSCH